ncbi:MAG: hypothetical protein KC440_06025 [Nitrosarchaeum sp.]|nr:hypothetical protein [Nitrosarchaeum sp.]
MKISVVSAINNKSKTITDKRSILLVSGIIIVAASLLFVYLIFYTSPEYHMEMVKIITITESGCIAETLYGHAVNIGDRKHKPGQYVYTLVDQKVKQHAALMNPTS